MKETYYVHTVMEEDGKNKIHTSDCERRPKTEHEKYVGHFTNCGDALREARRYYPLTADGCFYCCKDCYHR